MLGTGLSLGMPDVVIELRNVDGTAAKILTMSCRLGEAL